MEHHHKRKRNKNMAGKLITILQLILSAGLLILVWNSGMVPGLYLYRAVYNMGEMSLRLSAPWLVSALLIIMALPLGLIFARILTDRSFRHCT